MLTDKMQSDRPLTTNPKKEAISRRYGNAQLEMLKLRLYL
jgi:hypothetical protein